MNKDQVVFYIGACLCMLVALMFFAIVDIARKDFSGYWLNIFIMVIVIIYIEFKGDLRYRR